MIIDHQANTEEYLRWWKKYNQHHRVCKALRRAAERFEELASCLEDPSCGSHIGAKDAARARRYAKAARIEAARGEK